MDNLEEKLSAALNDPQTMEKVMALARSLGQNDSAPTPDMAQALSGLAGQGSIDKNQQMLLQALSPYLSSQRLSRLERAMRAAGLAGMATTMLGISGRTGR